MNRKIFAAFILTLTALVVVSAIGPAEKTLGSNARVVYLHGAWVWTALACMILSGAVGVVGLLSRSDTWNVWSKALGRSGLFFWLTYLPLSMWAMQTNWNGLFLAEPRWRFALVFAVGGIILQAGITLLEKPVWASVANLAYVIVLFASLLQVENVMHPSSPIFQSDALRIQVHYILLLALTLTLAGLVTMVFQRMGENHLQAEPS
jgi:hypothetical protein